MKMRGLLIAAVVLAALSGTLYWSNHRKPAEDTAKASSDTPPKILTLNESDVSAIDIKKKDEPEIDLAKDNSGNWQIDAPQHFGADQSTVSSMLSTLSSLNSDRLIEDKASNLAQYGLSEPSIKVDIQTKDKKNQELLVGDATPAGSTYYAALAGDPRVFTIASYNKSNIDKSVKDLRDKRLITADLDKVSQIELISPKQDITFGRNKEEWQIVKPKPMRADNFQMDELVRALRDAKMETTADTDEKANSKAFNSGTRIATVKITNSSGTQELEVRKDKDKSDYYAKSSVVDGVFKVANDVGTGLDKKIDDFRNKKLFDFGYSDPDKIEIHDGAKAYFLTRSGTDWWDGNGKKLDITTVQDVLEKLRGLSANKFPESGFTSSVIDLMVVSNDGKRTEKVSISKSGDNYIAQRANEPALYELSASSITDLQKSAADLKVAPPPPPAAATSKPKK